MSLGLLDVIAVNLLQCFDTSRHLRFTKLHQWSNYLTAFAGILHRPSRPPRPAPPPSRPTSVHHGSELLLAPCLPRLVRLSAARRVAEFNCAECGARFVRKYDRDRHVRTVHNSEEFSCRFCGSSIRRLDNLYSHVKRIHGAAALRQLRAAAGVGVQHWEGLSWPAAPPPP